MSSEPAKAPPEHDDSETISAAARGDERAWRQLVLRYKRLVYSIPRSYRFSDDGCDDVFQTVFAALVRELPKLQDPRALPKWLITSTHRACWKAAKSRTVELHPEATVAAADLDEDRADLWERRQALDVALSELGGRCEKLLRLLYLSPVQIPYEEVGVQLGMAVGSIGPTRARCLAKLADLMV